MSSGRLDVSRFAGGTPGPAAHALEFVIAVQAFIILSNYLLDLSDIWPAANSTHEAFTSSLSISILDI